MLQKKPPSTPAASAPRVRYGLLPQLRRDLRMLWKELLGEQPVSFHLRTGAASAAAGAPAPGLATRPLRVARVTRETADAVTLHLEDPAGAPLAWQPGQFFTLLVRLPGGETLRRAYSACWPVGQGPLPHAAPVTIKRVAGGRVSNHLNDHVREGDLIDVLGPSGSFTVPAEAAAARRELVLIGGGSGITPLSAILHAALADDAGARVTLLYGNRGEADVIFRAELDALATRHADRFTLRHVLSDPPPGFAGGTGLLDEATCARELAALPATADAEYFVCGPAPMMDAVRTVLRARGVPAARLHEEKFTSPGAGAAAGAADAGDPAVRAALATAQPIQVRHGGALRSITARPGETILEAGLAAGLPMPYSCAMGGCGACKVTLKSGTTVLDDPGCLTREERAAGFVLACQARATSPCTVEVPA